MDLPDPGIKPRSPAMQAGAITSEPPGKPRPPGLYPAPGGSEELQEVLKGAVSPRDRLMDCHSALAQEVQSSIQLVRESWGLLSSHFRAKSPHLCVEPAGLCGRCTGVAVPLRVVPSATGLDSLHFQAKLIIPEPFAHSFGIQACTATHRHVQNALPTYTRTRTHS